MFVVVVVFVSEISFTPAPPSTPVNVAGKTSLAFAKASITAVQSVGMSDIEGMRVGTNPCEEAAAAAPSAANPPTYGKLILFYTLLSLSLCVCVLRSETTETTQTMRDIKYVLYYTRESNADVTNLFSPCMQEDIFSPFFSSFLLVITTTSSIHRTKSEDELT